MLGKLVGKRQKLQALAAGLRKCIAAATRGSHERSELMNTRHLTIAAMILCLPLALDAQGKGHGNGKGKGGEAHGGHEGGKAKGGEQHGNAQGNEQGRGNSDARFRVQDIRPQISQRPEKALRKQEKRVEHEQKKIDHEIAKAAKQNRAVEFRETGGDVVTPRNIVLFAPLHNRPARTIAFADVPVVVRPFILSPRPEERLAAKALALALNNGADPNALTLARLGSGVVITNPEGVVLLGFDQSTASNLGAWRVVNVNDNVKSDAPSFCRSGAGHPVWGRQWCIDKGFGLGAENDIRWATTPVSNIVFAQEPTTEQLITTAVLRQVLGATAFDRLATHAITLGLVNPLTATWLGQPTGSRTLYVQSGTYPIAEFVDANRDGRPETMLVVTKPR
jgi:hypothetical protein